MKKIYFAPKTDVVEVKSQPLLGASDPNALFDPDSSTGTMDSRRGDFDFFDDEDY